MACGLARQRQVQHSAEHSNGSHFECLNEVSSGVSETIRLDQHMSMDVIAYPGLLRSVRDIPILSRSCCFKVPQLTMIHLRCRLFSVLEAELVVHLSVHSCIVSHSRVVPLGPGALDVAYA
jgi:hypothetical protein